MEFVIMDGAESVAATDELLMAAVRALKGRVCSVLYLA